MQFVQAFFRDSYVLRGKAILACNTFSLSSFSVNFKFPRLCSRPFQRLLFREHKKHVLVLKVFVFVRNKSFFRLFQRLVCWNPKGFQVTEIGNGKQAFLGGYSPPAPNPKTANCTGLPLIMWLLLMPSLLRHPNNALFKTKSTGKYREYIGMFSHFFPFLGCKGNRISNTMSKAFQGFLTRFCIGRNK